MNMVRGTTHLTALWASQDFVDCILGKPLLFGSAVAYTRLLPTLGVLLHFVFL